MVGPIPARVAYVSNVYNCIQAYICSLYTYIYIHMYAWLQIQKEWERGHWCCLTIDSIVESWKESHLARGAVKRICNENAKALFIFFGFFRYAMFDVWSSTAAARFELCHWLEPRKHLLDEKAQASPPERRPASFDRNVGTLRVGVEGPIWRIWCKKKQACTMAAYMVTILINWVSWATYFWEGLCMSATRYHKVIWVTYHLLPEIIWCVPLPLPTNLTKDLRIHKSLWAGHSWCSEKVLTRVLEKLDPDLK